MQCNAEIHGKIVLIKTRAKKDEGVYMIVQLVFLLFMIKKMTILREILTLQ